ncbi:hypothetical protein PFLUV_G00134220 [Perca fluviatilis]|uniref:Uncharacterized protein n=1 Tax=Perca fluviatilis TaxID=8168 RepID=A0A6A5ENC8_PERFL|nr:hypothetical protein PFLUV_G00134220 [Perca fluviatilis]
MDRSVLLVLWCLQAFLLIASFTSTDAAALVRDDHQQQSIDLVAREEKKPGSKKRKKQCGWYHGGCGFPVQ